MSNSQHRCVFVGNIPYDATEDQLIQICEEVGPVVSFRLVLDRDTGKPKGYGFCEFRDEETALSARRNLQGYEINGRQLRVDFAENDKGVDRNREQGRGGPGFTSTYDSQKQVSGVRTGDASFQHPVGIAAAAAAASVMASALGGPQASVLDGQPNSGTIGIPRPGAAVGIDRLTIHLASMSKHQLFEIISQMKGVVQQNQQHARQILGANPQLTKALFQAQVILGLVQPSQMNVPTSSMSQSVLQRQAVSLPQTSQTQLMHPHSVQTSLVQFQPIQPVQQRQMLQPQVSTIQSHIPRNALVQSQVQDFQQSQIPTSYPSQSVPFQPPMQLLQQSQKGPTQLLLQNVSQVASSSTIIQPSGHLPSVSIQAHIPPAQHIQPQQPLVQHSQPPSIQLPSQQLSLSQLHYPPAAPLVQPVQSMGFQLPPIQQQASLHRSADQSSIGVQHQVFQQPSSSLPQQPFQISNSSAELGSSSIQSSAPDSGSMLVGGVNMTSGGHQQVRSLAIGGTGIRPTPPATWNQIPHSGSVSIIADVPMVMTGNISCNITSNGGTGSVAASRSDGPNTSVAVSQGHSQVTQSSSQLQQPQLLFELEQQKVLLEQVMNLTPEQISSLPPEQRQQVIQLQQALRG